MLTFDEKTHTYTLDGVRLPSVTEVTRFLSVDYKSDRPWLAQAAAQRGSDIHALTALIDYGEDPEDVPFEYEGYIKAYRRFLRDYRPEWSGIEVALADATRGFAGTVDRYGTIGGNSCVLDIKTGHLHAPAITAQLCGYHVLLMLCKGFVADALYGLQLRSDGTYALMAYRYYPDIFAACMTLHDANKRLKGSKVL